MSSSQKDPRKGINSIEIGPYESKFHLDAQLLAKKMKKALAAGMLFMTMGSPLGTPNVAFADDELAKICS